MPQPSVSGSSSPTCFSKRWPGGHGSRCGVRGWGAARAAAARGIQRGRRRLAMLVASRRGGLFWKENQEEKDTTDRRGRWLIASSRGTPCPRRRAPPAPPGAASEPRPPPSSQPRLPVPPPWGIADIRGWITSGATRHLTRRPFGVGSPSPPDPSRRRDSPDFNGTPFATHPVSSS